MVGPLHGTRVVEFAALGPAPHAAMMLADLGAQVVRIERPVAGELKLAHPERDPLLRGRRIVAADLKRPDQVEAVLELLDQADVLVEGLRPGTIERLGLGPDVVLARNPRLVYGRVSGWGQDGPLASEVGHDLNFVALTGALYAMGRPDSPPPPPLNLVADFGGGSMLLLGGILAALIDRERTGKGQVVDAAMVDGIAQLSQLILGLRSAGRWTERRGTNLIDGGTPYYDSYVCADGRFIAVAALESRFFAGLLEGLEITPGDLAGDRHDPATWPRMRALFASRFLARSRDAWAERFARIEACVTPVLDFAEAARHPHLLARGTYVETADGIAAAPAPRFSRSRTAAAEPPSAGTIEDALDAWTAPVE